MMCLYVYIEFLSITKKMNMNRSPITAQNMNGYDFRIEEHF